MNTRFMEALSHAFLVKQEDMDYQVLTLVNKDAKEVNWPGLNDHRIFVRPVYETLYESTFETFKAPGKGETSHKLLLGVPGIGKSSFGLYLLWRLVKDGRNVLYQYPKCCGEGTILKFGNPETMDDVYIVDGCEPTEGLQYTTIMLSSPRGGKDCIYHEFRKDSIPYYLAVPSHDEMEALRKICFPNVNRDLMLERISIVGNVPRTVLSSSATNEIKEFHKALKNQKISFLREYFEREDDTLAISRISFRVLHYFVVDDPKESQLMWASRYAEKKIVEMILNEEIEDSLYLLNRMLESENLIRLSGTLFERWCSLTISEGSGSTGFKIRRLGVGSISGGEKAATLNHAALLKAADQQLQQQGATLDDNGVGSMIFPKSSSTVVESLKDLRLDPGSRLVTKTGFEAADFVEVGGVCSNATVSSSHTLVVQGKDDHGLFPVFQQLYPSKDIAAVPFFWLGPPLVFPKMHAGVMVVMHPTEGGKEQAKAAKVFATKVVQYAVEIPLPTPGVKARLLAARS